MTPFLADKQKEFSENLIDSQEKFHYNNWNCSCEDIFSNFKKLWQDSFNFYILSPFANILDELDIINFLFRIYEDMADLLKNIIGGILNFAMTLTNLLICDVNAAGKSFDQTLKCTSKVILNALDIVMNMVLLVLSPIARIIATPIWYAQTPD